MKPVVLVPVLLGLAFVLLGVSSLGPTLQLNGNNLNLIAANKLAANKLAANKLSANKLSANRIAANGTSRYGPSDETPMVLVRAVTLADGTRLVD